MGGGRIGGAAWGTSTFDPMRGAIVTGRHFVTLSARIGDAGTVPE
jgi:hypothetical protein